MSEILRQRPGTVAAERWALPPIEGPILGTRHDAADARASAAEAAIARAQAGIAAEAAAQEARERGYQDGLKAAQAQMQSKLDQAEQQINHLEAILGRLAKPLADLDEEVEQQLARLATAVGRQLARRELSADPGQIIVLIREAVGRLPASARDVRVHLNPRDAAAVRERLASPAQDRAWTLIEDPTLTQGGCLVRSDNSQLDARLESRLNAIAAELFGEPRARDRDRTIEPPTPDAVAAAMDIPT